MRQVNGRGAAAYAPGIARPYFRPHVVPAVLALATPSWRSEVWLAPEEFGNLDFVVHVLFGDFCDATAPEQSGL
ncbi:hypothetical protein ABZ479_09665 [Streptomyces sp. NPDC005722]